MKQQYFVFLNLIFLTAIIHIAVAPCSVTAKQYVDDHTIRIGLMVSKDPGTDPLSREAIDAASLAIDEINKGGGLGGRSAELIVRSSDGDWGSGSIKSVELIYDEEVHAIVGSLEGRDAHLVEMAIAKAHVIYLETRAADPTLSEANLPWFFRIVPSDKQQAQKLASEIYENSQVSNLMIIHSDSYDDQMAANTFLRHVRDNHLPVPVITQFTVRSPDYRQLIESLKKTASDAILVFGDTEFLIGLSSEMKQTGIHLPLFTNHSILHAPQLLPYLRNSGDMTFICPSGWQSDGAKSFRDNFYNTFGYQPGAIGAYTYDGIHVIARAIGRDFAIGDEFTKRMANTDYNRGVTGHIRFLETGDINDTTEICRISGFNR